jgi:tRNA (guanine37-N1)-methyltransferase
MSISVPAASCSIHPAAFSTRSADVRIDIITIFPDYLDPLRLGLIGRARESGVLDVHVHDLRACANDRHRTVDDTPYGGGAGMVMRPEPWGAALDQLLAAAPSPPRLIVPSPAGTRFDQALAAELAAEPTLAFACGRYEGIDARVVEAASQHMRVDEVSIGDYVLGGGEVAALVIVEAVVRLVPGVVGNADSLAEESHVGGLLEYPVYTKPDSWRGLDVPAVLRSGHHGEVARWRRTAALRRTSAIRPDLITRLDPSSCDAADLTVLAELGWSATADGGGFLRSDPTVRD